MIKVFRSFPISKIRLLVFDLDGTLVDSKLDLANAVNAMLVHYGRPLLNNKLVESFVGDGAPMLVRRALNYQWEQKVTDAAVQDGLKFFMAHYRVHKLDNTLCYKGIPEALEAIAGRLPQVKMAVLSNKPEGPSRGICEGLGLNKHLFAVYGGNSFATKKPEPEGANALLREAGVQPEEAIMIGDSGNDVMTGINAGMWTLGVNWGFSPQTLIEHPPDVQIDEVGELLRGLGLE
jgi:phosphoglycolate phosphatase